MTPRDVAWPVALALVAISCAAPGASPAASPTPPPQSQTVNPDAQIQQQFLEQVRHYLEVRKAAEGKLTRLPDKAEPEAISAHQTALLRALQSARRGAKPGDVFQERTRPLIRRLVAGAIASEGGAPKAAIEDENPGSQIRIAVNGPYPTTLPLATVPPQVLLALPRLPDEQLEYRFLGRRLILLDARANMVVDYMERAIP